MRPYQLGVASIVVALVAACGGILGIEDRKSEGEYPTGGYEGCDGQTCNGCTTSYHECRCAGGSSHQCYDPSQGYAGCRPGDCSGCGDPCQICACDTGDENACVADCQQADFCGEFMRGNDCAGCLCGACGTQIDECGDDADCRAILECVTTNECGDGDCVQNGPCSDVVRAHGGLRGAGVEKVGAIAQCADEASCGCGGPSGPDAGSGEPPEPTGDCAPDRGCHCADCMETCLCEGHEPLTCNSQCEGPSACQPPDQCASCDNCVDQCVCAGGDVFGCQDECGRDSVACPDSPSDVPGVPSGRKGCCTPEGTCGYELGSVCVSGLTSGPPIACPPP